MAPVALRIKLRERGWKYSRVGRYWYITIRGVLITVPIADAALAVSVFVDGKNIAHG